MSLASWNQSPRASSPPGKPVKSVSWMCRSESAAVLMLYLYFAPRPRVAQLLLSSAFLPLLSASHLCFFLSHPPLTVHLPPLADSSLSSLSLILLKRVAESQNRLGCPLPCSSPHVPPSLSFLWRLTETIIARLRASAASEAVLLP